MAAWDLCFTITSGTSFSSFLERAFFEGNFLLSSVLNRNRSMRWRVIVSDVTTNYYLPGNSSFSNFFSSFWLSMIALAYTIKEMTMYTYTLAIIAITFFIESVLSCSAESSVSARLLFKDYMSKIIIIITINDLITCAVVALAYIGSCDWYFLSLKSFGRPLAGT